MGLLQGQMSFRLFDVEGGPISEDDVDKIYAAAKKFAFRELSGEKEESIGWVSSDNLLDTDLDGDKIHYQQYLVLSLRVDKKVVAAPYFKARLERELEDFKKKANTEKVSMADKKHLREELRRTLVRQAEPRRRTFDMCWDLYGARVYFFASAEGIADTFADHFKRTFNRRLQPVRIDTRIRRALGKEGDDMIRLTNPATL